MKPEAKFEFFHDQGEEPGKKTIEKFGMPVHSLYATRDVISKNQEIDVFDDEGNVLYKSVSKVSFLDKTDITDGSGNPVAHFERKKLSLRERHILTMENGMEILLEKELMHLIKEVTNIRQLEWQIKGYVHRLNFQLVDKDENIVAAIGQRMIAKKEKYSIDVYQTESEDVIACILILLIHIVRDRNIKDTRKITKVCIKY